MAEHQGDTIKRLETMVENRESPRNGPLVAADLRRGSDSLKSCESIVGPTCYLGDGAFARREGENVILYNSYGLHPNNSIYLELKVAAALRDYLVRTL